MTLILFVCRGNTCRSPMAEVVARAAAARAGLGTPITFASAGVTPSLIRGPADPRAVACVATRARDLSGHRTTAANAALLSRAAHIYALDARVRDDVIRLLGPAHAVPVALLMDLVPGHAGEDVPDPYHGTPDDYAHALAMIELAVIQLILKLQPPNPNAPE
jgi:protein-tyrosine phosphatase